MKRRSSLYLEGNRRRREEEEEEEEEEEVSLGENRFP